MVIKAADDQLAIAGLLIGAVLCSGFGLKDIIGFDVLNVFCSRSVGDLFSFLGISCAGCKQEHRQQEADQG